MERQKSEKIRICGIYRFENTIEHKSYIGQSIDINRCINAHYYGISSFDKILKENPQQFIWEIVEECEYSQLNERERYWIEYYDSYHNGYNSTPGGSGVIGENNPRAILTKEYVIEIRTAYDSHIPFREVFEKYKNIISRRGLQKVWHFETWLDIMPEVYTQENIKWHATTAKGFQQGDKNNQERQITKDEFLKIKELRVQGLSFQAIGDLIGRSKSTVRKYCMAAEYSPAKTNSKGISIKNLETGKEFGSLTAAISWLNYGHRKSLSRRLKANPNNAEYGYICDKDGHKILAHWTYN